MISKTIILTKENSTGRGIITLSMQDDLLLCKLRLYNLPSLNKNTKISVYHQDEVFSANLIEKQGVYLSSLAGNFDLSKDFYIALSTPPANQIELSGGSYAGCFECNDAQQNEPTPQPEQPEPQPQPNCATCKYKQAFYASAQTSTPQPKIQQTNSNEDDITAQLLPQLNDIFNTYPPNTELNTLFGNSSTLTAKFVEVRNTTSYSIGAIYEGETLKYICYAVKTKYNAPPPEELGKHHQWLPLDDADPLSDGYHLLFQNAKDLSLVEL